MSCFLCDSFYHLTQNCDVYISDETIKEKIISKIKNPSTKFFSSKKCYFCCLRSHNTLFCPDRFTSNLLIVFTLETKRSDFSCKIFVPNIDKILFQRFLKFWDPFEKILFASQSPTTFYESVLEPLTILDTIKYSQYTTMPNIQTKIIICKNLELCHNFLKSDTYRTFFEQICFKDFSLFAENITVTNIPISSVTLSVLLSSRTKFFKISKVEFQSNVTLDDIFKHAPNLEEFNFNTWHDRKWQYKDFFKHKYGKNFKKLKITVNDDFDVGSLVHFMNKGPSNIKIDVYVSIFTRYTNARELFLQKVSKSFIPADLSNDQSFSLYLQIHGLWNDEFMFSGSFAL